MVRASFKEESVNFKPSKDNLACESESVTEDYDIGMLYLTIILNRYIYSLTEELNSLNELD